MNRFFSFAVLLLFGSIFFSAAAQNSTQTSRQIAITFDDLIFVPQDDLQQIKASTSKLLRTLRTNKVPVVGFVNESKINVANEAEARTDILKLWVEAGFELGNHTYSHLDLFTATPEKFKDELMKGEQITRKIMAAKGRQERYFRHPFLNTGSTAENKAAFDKILGDHNYTVAPVTVDNSDYMFAKAYADALKKNDRVMMQRVADAYIPYMNSVVAFYEQQSKILLGYELKQILLVHANPLNADHFGEIIAMLRKRGYQFITLEAALRDRAYEQEDKYTGRAGISWLQRWAMTQKHQATIKQFKLEPAVPDFIKKAYENRQ